MDTIDDPDSLDEIKEEAEEAQEIAKAVPLEVFVDGDNIERALKALKRKLIREGVFKEYKAKKYYEKPAVKRKRKNNEIKRKIQRIEAERLNALQGIK